MSRNLPATIRNTVWNEYIGKTTKIGNCFCCEHEVISFANFECGHVESFANGGSSSIDNLRPICSLCNKSMGKRNMKEFMEEFGLNCEKKKKIEPIQNQNDEKIFLEKFNLKQLQQVCKLFEIYNGGTKDKLIGKILKKQISKNDVLLKINIEKIYLAFCEGVPYCNKCLKKDEIMIHCDNCLQFSKNNHYYYSDCQDYFIGDEIINSHRKIRDGKIKCNECNKITYIEIYPNYFYQSKI